MNGNLDSIKLTAIMACDLNGGIGYENGLPWRGNRADLAWFKSVTMGSMLLMSKKTYDSIPVNLNGRWVAILNRPTADVTDLREVVYEEIKYHTFRDQALAKLCGGKIIYNAYWGMVETLCLTIIPRDDYEADTKVDLEGYLNAGWSVRFLGGCKKDSAYCYLIVLDRTEGKGDPSINKTIPDHFEPYVKLTAKTNVTINPGANGVIDVNELLAIPFNQTGIFSPRKSLAKLGLYTSAQIFKQSWVGKPELVVTNMSGTKIEIIKGDELGEMALVTNSNF